MPLSRFCQASLPPIHDNTTDSGRVLYFERQDCLITKRSSLVFWDNGSTRCVVERFSVISFRQVHAPQLYVSSAQAPLRQVAMLCTETATAVHGTAIFCSLPTTPHLLIPVRAAQPGLLVPRRWDVSPEPWIVPPRQGPLRSTALTCGDDPMAISERAAWVL